MLAMEKAALQTAEVREVPARVIEIRGSGGIDIALYPQRTRLATAGIVMRSGREGFTQK